MLYSIFATSVPLDATQFHKPKHQRGTWFDVMERTEYLQEVILSVAVEGATQAQAVILPGGVQAQVEAEFRPAVVELQAQGSANLQEHGGQLLDLEHFCGGRFDLLGFFNICVLQLYMYALANIGTY